MQSIKPLMHTKYNIFSAKTCLIILRKPQIYQLCDSNIHDNHYILSNEKILRFLYKTILTADLTHTYHKSSKRTVGLEIVLCQTIHDTWVVYAAGLY